METAYGFRGPWVPVLEQLLRQLKQYKLPLEVLAHQNGQEVIFVALDANGDITGVRLQDFDKVTFPLPAKIKDESGSYPTEIFKTLSRVQNVFNNCR